MSEDIKKDQMQNAWDLFQPQLISLNKEMQSKSKKRGLLVGGMIIMLAGIIALNIFTNYAEKNITNANSARNQDKLSQQATSTSSKVEKENDILSNALNTATSVINSETLIESKDINESINNSNKKTKEKKYASSISYKKLLLRKENNNSHEQGNFSIIKTENDQHSSPIDNLGTIISDNKLEEKTPLYSKNISISLNEQSNDDITNITSSKNDNEREKIFEKPGSSETLMHDQFTDRKVEIITTLPVISPQELLIDKEGCIKVVVNNNPFKNKINVGLSIGPAETTIYAERQIRVNGFYYSVDGAYSINKILNVGLRFNHQRYSSTAKYIINPEVNNKYQLSNLMINLGIKIVEVKKTELILNVARGYALENTLKRKSIINNNEVTYEHIQENQYGLNYHVVAQLRYKIKPNYAIGLEALLEDNGYERTLFGLNINHKF